VNTGLSRAKIAAAALDLIDSEGLENLSARTLARDLGCGAMSLYHHVENMDDVLDLVAERLLSQLAFKQTTSLRAALLKVSRDYIGLAQAHPNAFPLLATRRLRGPKVESLADSLVGLFGVLGVGQREGMRRIRVLAAYLNGAGLALAMWRREGANAAREAAIVRADLEAGLKTLIAALCT
jgi:AcrR family transcriptional regulator